MNDSWKQYKRESLVEIANRIAQQLLYMDDSADAVANVYAERMFINPEAAILQFDEFMGAMRNVNQDSSYEAYVGGPNHDWTSQILNVVGSVYPALDKTMKEVAFRKCMVFLNSLRYDYSQNHVELIQEPRLVGDISSHQSLYWPGFQSTKNLLLVHHDWYSFRDAVPESLGAIFVALPILKKEYASKAVQDEFCKQMPDLVDATLDACVARINASAMLREKNGEMLYADTVLEKIASYDLRHHEMLKQKLLEKNWVYIPGLFR